MKLQLSPSHFDGNLIDFLWQLFFMLDYFIELAIQNGSFTDEKAIDLNPEIILNFKLLKACSFEV